MEDVVSDAKKELLKQLDAVFLTDNRTKEFYVSLVKNLNDDEALDIAADIFIALKDRSDIMASNNLLRSCFQRLRGERSQNEV